MAGKSIKNKRKYKALKEEEGLGSSGTALAAHEHGQQASLA